MIIYKALNKINGKIYIGITNKNLDQRIYEHFHRGKSRQLFNRALRKYGLQSFEISVIDSTLLREIACEKEIYWIKHYNSKVPNGYNQTDGGEGVIGHRCSEETKRKISLARKGKGIGRIVSEETRRRIGLANKQKEHFPLTEERKRNLSKARMGHITSEETRNKISNANKGKKRLHPYTDEHKRKLSEAGKLDWQRRKGTQPCDRKLSDDTKRKMSQAHTGKKLSETTKRKISEKVKQFFKTGGL